MQTAIEKYISDTKIFPLINEFTTHYVTEPL